MPSRMRNASLFVAVAAGLATASPARTDEAPRWPTNTVLLFVAGWCAPCHAELREMDALAAAAEPRRLLVVPADQTRSTAAMVRPLPAARVWRDPAVLRALWSGALGAGLPLTLATDGEGRVCGEHRRVLRPGDLAALAARCGRR